MDPTTEPTISIEENPNPADLQLVWDMLIAHNASQAGPSNFQKLSILARNTNQEIIGGLNGYTFWHWLYIENFAIAENERGKKLGSRIIKAAEQEAIKRGCKSAHVDTFSFQALAFYQKHGYNIFGTLYNFPEPHQKYFLSKMLI